MLPQRLESLGKNTATLTSCKTLQPESWPSLTRCRQNDP